MIITPYKILGRSNYTEITIDLLKKKKTIYCNIVLSKKY